MIPGALESGLFNAIESIIAFHISLMHNLDLMKRKIHVVSDHVEIPGLPVVADVMNNCSPAVSHWSPAICTLFLYHIVQDTCP
jgi:hypothetical protein